MSKLFFQSGFAAVANRLYRNFFKIFLSFPRAAILTVAYIVYLRSEHDLCVLGFNFKETFGFLV